MVAYLSPEPEGDKRIEAYHFFREQPENDHPGVKEQGGRLPGESQGK